MSQGSIIDVPARPDYVSFAPGFGQRFILTVDTEEEFDWTQPIVRQGHSLDTVPKLRNFQEFCDAFGVKPVYLVDYPIAVSSLAIDILGSAASEGRCEIGMQLHPWVSPPFVEDVTEHNTYAGNLTPDLERDKLWRLYETITRNFQHRPVIYRAGRYGAGPETHNHLRELGIAIDSSVRPRFDYSHGGGPSYRDHPERPYWIDRPGGLLEAPLTSIYWGPLRKQGHWLYPRICAIPHARGLLARLGLLERIPLTPEGVTAEEALRAIDIAIDDGLPLLVLSFHSPSLRPGNTPYVRSEEDLDRFYDWWRQIFAHLARRGIAAATVSELMSAARLA